MRRVLDDAARRDATVVMRLFEWNALRTGDVVRVHDPAPPHLNLLRGVVAVVDSRGGAHSVEIRLESGARAVTVRPRRLWVHLAAGDERDACFRCAEALGR